MIEQILRLLDENGTEYTLENKIVSPNKLINQKIIYFGSGSCYNELYLITEENNKYFVYSIFFNKHDLESEDRPGWMIQKYLLEFKKNN